MAYPYIQREDAPTSTKKQMNFLMRVNHQACAEAIAEAGFITVGEYEDLMEDKRQERIKRDPLGAIRGTEEEYLKIFGILEAGGIANGENVVLTAQRVHKLNIPQLEEFAHRLVAKIKKGDLK